MHYTLDVQFLKNWSHCATNLDSRWSHHCFSWATKKGTSIVGPWSDGVTNLDYTQDSSSSCGSLPSINEVLNPNIAHDLEIMRPHFLKGNDARNFVPQVYTDEEEREREDAINYLRNRSAASEEPIHWGGVSVHEEEE